MCYLCAAFSQKAGPVSHTGKSFHSHHFIHQEATAIKLVTFMDLKAFHRGAWLKHPNSFSSISFFFFFFLIPFYLDLHRSQSFLPGLVRSFGEFSPCRSIRQLPNRYVCGTEKGIINDEILLCVTAVSILVYEE